MPKDEIDYVRFKSEDKYWQKEVDGRKCNTERELDKHDKRFNRLLRRQTKKTG